MCLSLQPLLFLSILLSLKPLHVLFSPFGEKFQQSILEPVCKSLSQGSGAGDGKLLSETTTLRAKHLVEFSSQRSSQLDSPDMEPLPHELGQELSVTQYSQQAMLKVEPFLHKCELGRREPILLNYSRSATTQPQQYAAGGGMRNGGALLFLGRKFYNQELGERELWFFTAVVWNGGRKGRRGGLGSNTTDSFLLDFHKFSRIDVCFFLLLPLETFPEALNSLCFCNSDQFYHRTKHQSYFHCHAGSQSHHYVLDQAKQRVSELWLKAAKQSGTQNYHL